MKPLPHHASSPAERDPFAPRDDRTPEELAAIRGLAAELDALLDAPFLHSRPAQPLPAVEDDELAVTRDALPTVIAQPPERPPALESGLADRMRGVLRGVLVRARRNRSPR